MPDWNSVTFWGSLASTPWIQNNPAVLFDLYNEPYDPSGSDSTFWGIWKNGTIQGNTGGTPANTPGMEYLLNTIRTAGADNVIVAGGLNWAYDLRGIVGKAPFETADFNLTDSLGNGVIYAAHIYPDKGTSGTWSSSTDGATYIVPCAKSYPVIVTEFNEGGNIGTPDGNGAWINSLISWFSSTSGMIGGSSWAFSDDVGPTLLNSYYSTNTYGAAVSTWISNAAKTPTPICPSGPTYTPTNTPTSTPTLPSTSTFTKTATNTPTKTFTTTSTSTPSLTPTNTTNNSPTDTSTPSNTPTPSFTSTHTNSPTNTCTTTYTNSTTPSATPTNSPTFSPTGTPTNSPTSTPTMTATSTDTYTVTNSFTPSPTNTPTGTLSPTLSPTPTDSFTSSPTSTYTISPTSTWTATSTNSATSTCSSTPTNSITNTWTLTPTSSLTSTQTNTPSNSITPTFTYSFTATYSPTFTPTLPPTSTFTNSPTKTFSPTYTPTTTPTVPAPILYPNPVKGNQPVQLALSLTQNSDVKIEIFTVGFRRVKEQTNSNQPVGRPIRLSQKTLGEILWPAGFIMWSL